MQVGLIGLGIMGAPMARNLLNAGFSVTVATRTPGKAAKFAAEAASLGEVRAVETPAEVAACVTVGEPSESNDVSAAPSLTKAIAL